MELLLEPLRHYRAKHAQIVPLMQLLILKFATTALLIRTSLKMQLLMLENAKHALTILTRQQIPQASLLACVMLTTLEMPPPVLALFARTVVSLLLKHQLPLSIPIANAQPTLGEPMALHALLAVARLVLVPQMLDPSFKLLAHAQLTIMEMPAPVLALLAQIAVPLLLETQMLLLLACALSANGPQLEQPPTVLALIALLVLLTQLLAPLSLPIATARLTFMEMAEPLLVHALLVLTAPLMLKQQQLSLPLLIADAKQTLTEQQWTTVPHAHFALLQIYALLLVLTKLHAVALLIHTGTLAHALLALSLLLGPLLDPLPLLLAFAPLTTSELELEPHALFALMVEPLTSNW
jgi:hypothetical protein